MASFLSEGNQQTLRARLTDYGRERLSTGRLDFAFFGIGDSEIDYSVTGSTSILSPAHNQSQPSTFILDDECDTDPLFLLSALKETSFKAVDTAKPRGFFLDPDVLYYKLKATPQFTKQTGVLSFSGGSDVTLDKAQNVAVGDHIFIKVSNQILSSTTAEMDERLPCLMFRIEGLAGTVAKLDREVPSGINASDSYYQVYPSGFPYYDKDPERYWNEASYNFEDTCPPVEDVPVWNMNIAWPRDAIGRVTTVYEGSLFYGSRSFLGCSSYLGLSGDTPFAIVHYSNNTISNFYAEAFHRDTAILRIPHVQWTSFGDIGISLVCSGGEKSVASDANDSFSLPYYDMVVEGTDVVVARCYPSLKVFAITDPELVAALSWKSNRSWVLPEPSISLVNIDTEPAIFDSDDEGFELWVTYHLDGPLKTLPYQKPVVFSLTGDTSCGNRVGGAVQIGFDAADLVNFAEFDSPVGDTLQYDSLSVLAQKVPVGEYPSPDDWISMPVALEGSSHFDATSGSRFYILDRDDFDSSPKHAFESELSMPLLTERDRLQLGDEFIFLGNVEADIEAKVFQSAFYLPLDLDRFNYSQNPTWDDSLGFVSISEAGIYDSSRRLVAIAKFPIPLRKPLGDNRTIIITIDF